MPLKAKMLPEGEAPQRQVIGMIAFFFFFLPSKVLSTLKNQNGAKVYLRGTLSQSETWLVSCIFFQVQPQCVQIDLPLFSEDRKLNYMATPKRGA